MRYSEMFCCVPFLKVWCSVRLRNERHGDSSALQTPGHPKRIQPSGSRQVTQLDRDRLSLDVFGCQKHSAEPLQVLKCSDWTSSRAVDEEVFCKKALFYAFLPMALLRKGVESLSRYLRRTPETSNVICRYSGSIVLYLCIIHLYLSDTYWYIIVNNMLEWLMWSLDRWAQGQSELWSHKTLLNCRQAPPPLQAYETDPFDYLSINMYPAQVWPCVVGISRWLLCRDMLS